jgi:acetyl-CoA carboxylase biotin carboxyl carrier protein
LDLKEIKQIIDLMKSSDLTEFSVEDENLKLKIRRQGATPPVVTTAPPAAAPAPAPAPAASAPTHLAPAGEADEPGVSYIKSPMVGTFYSAASPENPPFVDVNQKVQESTVVCIIEAMKIMNEIQAETKGTILEVLVENGQPVEFGQRLYKIKSD